MINPEESIEFKYLFNKYKISKIQDILFIEEKGIYKHEVINFRTYNIREKLKFNDDYQLGFLIGLSYLLIQSIHLIIVFWGDFHWKLNYGIVTFCLTILFTIYYHLHLRKFGQVHFIENENYNKYLTIKENDFNALIKFLNN